jgi:putative oxidoreductase
MIQFLFVFNDWGLLILRVVLGFVMIKHGFPKLRDIRGTGERFEKMGFRPGKLLALIVVVIEFFGGILLVFGLLTQIVSVFIVIQFALLVFVLGVVKREKFGEWEFDLLVVGAAALLVVSGGGVYSLDEFLGLLFY